MLYPVSVVDGLVHQLGGWTLQAELKLKRLLHSQPCPVGSAVVTSAGVGSLLSEQYDSIVHTTPPFYLHDAEPEKKLKDCYHAALSLSLKDVHVQQPNAMRVASPLLGAGARGFPVKVAIEIASCAVSDWCQQSDTNTSDRTIVFGLLEREHADHLCKAFEDQCAVVR
jgi:O-acetyl-ADP-ribose deacetylase (regulator of RNase III)